MKSYKIYRYWIMLDPDPKPWSYIGYTGATLNQRAGGLTGENYILYSSKFGAAIEAYGWPNFKVEVIEDGLTKEKAWEREQYWIQYYDSVQHGFNISRGGKGGGAGTHSNKGCHRTDSEKKHLAETKGIFKISQYDLTGTHIQDYHTIHEAGEKTGIAYQNIWHALKGHIKQAGGYIWVKNQLIQYVDPQPFT